MGYTVFGYGSLIFKPPPHTISRVPGFVKGYVRRFAQSSWDHRGTPERLGRVVTLIPTAEWAGLDGPEDQYLAEDVVWGVAYTIDPKYEDEVREYLDFREKNGYTVYTEDVYGFKDSGEEVVAPQCTVYVGRSDNPAFVGREAMDYLSHRIYTCSGPSGKNKDYLYELARAIRELAPASHDAYLAALEARVRSLDTNPRKAPSLNGKPKGVSQDIT